MDYVLGIVIALVVGFAAGGYFTPRILEWIGRSFR